MYLKDRLCNMIELLRSFRHPKEFVKKLLSTKKNLKQDEKSSIHVPYHILDCNIGRYSYIAQNSHVSNASIGHFCSIGPNFFAGWGIHPTTGISTHPFFYSENYKDGICRKTKVVERKRIIIGNDVFIGANVFIADGVRIGNGAVIGAGSVVVSDVEDYAVVGGSPAKRIRYRFSEDIIVKLQKIEWWNKDSTILLAIEQNFFEVEKFLEKYGNE